VPIEFRCHTCNRLLRTPDDSAGKPAKCPQCTAVLTVPVSSTSEEPTPKRTASPPTALPAGANPFAAADGGAGSQPNPFAAADGGVGSQPNPYASPTTFASEPKPELAGTDGLVQTRIDFGDVLGLAWNMFTTNFGICLLFGLICFGINMGSTVINLPLQFAPQMAGNEPIAIIGSLIIQTGIGILFQAFIFCLMVMFGLLLLRGNVSPLSEIWKLGPHFLPVALGYFVITLGVWVAIVIGAVPVGLLVASGDESLQIAAVIVGINLGLLLLIGYIYLLISVMLTFHFVVDRRLGLFDAVRTSMQFMRGNRLTALAIGLVVSVITPFVVIFTCFLGSIAVTPFMALVWTAIYLKATGQPVVA
jgi:phage FluMu protein Com